SPFSDSNYVLSNNTPKLKRAEIGIQSQRMTYQSELGENIFRERLKRFQKSMARDSFDSLIVVGQPQLFHSTTGVIRYIAKCAQYSSPTTMLITKDVEPIIFVSLNANRKQFRRCTWISDIRVVGPGSLGEKILEAIIERKTSGRIGSVGLENLPAKSYL